jgi:alkaline phosphatase
MKRRFTGTLLSITIFAVIAAAQLSALCYAQTGPVARIRLPERFRVLTGQLFDLRVEATGLTNTGATLSVFLDGVNITRQLGAPEVTIDNDANPADIDKAWTFRGVSLHEAGSRSPHAVINTGGQRISVSSRIGVQEFRLKGDKSIILFIGDAMGTAYRDVARIVAKSADNSFREGFFDELMEMDQMPVSGMVMTYALDRVVPDSANAAAAWASGNKTIEGALNVFPDNNDFRFSSSNLQATKQFALDNPRVETLWEYLKRRYGYKTGIVSTADITDATPAAEGAHSITRSLLFDIARQYVDGVFTGGAAFDVILGGGKEKFISRTATNSGDTRNLAAELQAAGFTYVQTRAELNALPSGGSSPNKLLGLFRTGNMDVAYDKLGLVRPPDEPTPNFGGFTDQPFLDEMTTKAIATLTRRGGPFILMVEGASIDKQSHPNHAAGQIWDTIEFDKAIGVGRAWAKSQAGRRQEPLLLVTADHDQSIHILGVVDTNVPNATQNVRNNVGFQGLTGEVAGFPDYSDANGDGYPENTNRFRVSVGYRTGGHTGSSVPITAEGSGAFLFTGYYDQTDIFFKMAKVLSSRSKSLERVLEELLERRSESDDDRDHRDYHDDHDHRDKQ